MFPLDSAGNRSAPLTPCPISARDIRGLFEARCPLLEILRELSLTACKHCIGTCDVSSIRQLLLIPADLTDQRAGIDHVFESRLGHQYLLNA